MNKNKILSIDISSNKVKVGLISENLKLDAISIQSYNIQNEDIDGFVKRFDMDELWSLIIQNIKNILKKYDKNKINLIGISSCAQRIACVFLDKNGKELYGGPNSDVRGIDSAYIIEDEFEENELFEVTAHSPSLTFCLARLLWFREEAENIYEKIHKVLMLNDWITYKLTGEYFSDFTSAPESQIFDIKKLNWSSEIIEAFDLNPDWFPEIIDSNTIAGNLRKDITKELGLNSKEIPVIKGGGDTNISVLGMGAIHENDIGICLGTTAPVDLVVAQ
ncbi:MAG: FGGY family carbohydrate kinase, partial [Candidatus Helarchaeota archaeon]